MTTRAARFGIVVACLAASSAVLAEPARTPSTSAPMLTRKAGTTTTPTPRPAKVTPVVLAADERAALVAKLQTAKVDAVKGLKNPPTAKFTGFELTPIKFSSSNGASVFVQNADQVGSDHVAFGANAGGVVMMVPEGVWALDCSLVHSSNTGYTVIVKGPNTVSQETLTAQSDHLFFGIVVEGGALHSVEIEAPGAWGWFGCKFDPL